MPFGDWSAYPPEVNSRRLFNGPGPGPMRETADSFRQFGQTFDTLASSVDSEMAQLDSTWNSEASDSASQSFRQYSTGLREMATVADTASQQADAQAAANDSARSSMPKEAAITAVQAGYTAALSSQNYYLAAALMAVYLVMWADASSTMSGYEGATMPNLPLPPPQNVPPITNPGQSAADAASKLAESFKNQPGQEFTPPEPMDTPPSDSSTLAELNGAESGSAGGAGGGLGGGAGGIGMVPGGLASMSSTATGFRVPPTWQTQPPPRALGLPGGMPAMAPMAGGAAPGAHGAGRRTRRDREKERTPLDGAVVAPDRSDEVPEIAGVGVVDVADPDDLAAPHEVAASYERRA